MGHRFADLLLRFRLPLLLLVVLGSLGMGIYSLPRLEFSQEFVSVIPENDPEFVRYNQFRQWFGEDGGSLLVALEGKGVYDYRHLNALHAYLDSLEREGGVTSAQGLTTVFDLRPDTASQRFVLAPVWPGPLRNQAQADSLSRHLLSQPFYKGLLYGPKTQALVCVVGLSKTTMKSRRKHVLVGEVTRRFDALAQQYGYTAHFAGLPYLRYYTFARLPLELAIFTGLALVFTILALWFFYRQFYAILIPLCVLILSAANVLGILALLGIQLTILNALLPPVIIILGVPPTIYMLGDYHEEYRRHRNKHLALRLMLSKLGLVTLMIMGNTALGFLTLYFTKVNILVDFGLVAFLGIAATFVVAIVVIPAAYSYLPPPTDFNLENLRAPLAGRFVNWVRHMVEHHRRWIYSSTAVIVGAGVVGLLQLEAKAFVVDDLPQGARVHRDLRFVEGEFGGALPIEVVVDTRRAGGANQYRNLKKLRQLQDSLETYPELSRTLSLSDVSMWGRQAVLGGDAAEFQFPLRDEFDVVGVYSTGFGQSRAADSGRANSAQALPQGLSNALADSTRRYLRITGFMQDVGSQQLPGLLKRVEEDARLVLGDTATNPRAPVAQVSGTTRIFMKSNDYLVENLKWSLLSTFILIALQFAVLYRSLRLTLIGFLANCVPLLVTGAVMGYFGIPLKPSTALIYQTSFTIAVDDCIHFLSMYRYERKLGLGRHEAVPHTLRITGKSMLYTSIVLFIGFIIFTPSAFGTTRSLGLLTGITLLVAMFINLLLVPALVLKFDRRYQKA